MAINTKAIKRRIKSVGNTKKITKAMEMISAVKMRRAVQNVLGTRSYASVAWEILTDIAKQVDINLHPLLQQRPVKKIGMILITSNRGLAGGFSSRLLSEANSFITDSETAPNPSFAKEGNRLLASAEERVRERSRTEIILTGKQGRKMYHKFGHTVIAEFDKLDITTKIEQIAPIAQLAISEYASGKYDKIVVAYTDYVSAITQVPRIKQILPLINRTGVSQVKTESDDETKNVDANSFDYGYTFEPGTKKVLDVLLPRLVEMQMYQTVLESDASEHSARMLAMKNASDAAKDMIKELNQSFNKARQAAITQEISEIVGGAAALG